MGLEDRFEKLFLIETDAAKMRGELIKELRVAWRIGRTEIIDGIDDTDAE
jgi:hypothetical protein